MAFTHWDPLLDLLSLQKRMDRLADAGEPGWTPPVDLYETPDGYVLTAELPGLSRDDVQIEVHDGVLSLQGRRPSANVPCEQFHRVERGHGAFSRRFALPVPIDADRVTADLGDGVLTVTVPKASGAIPRRIEVS